MKSAVHARTGLCVALLHPPSLPAPIGDVRANLLPFAFTRAPSAAIRSSDGGISVCNAGKLLPRPVGGEWKIERQKKIG